MRTVTALFVLLLIAGAALAQDRLSSPYRQQAETGLRALDEKEIADLKAGTGMGLAQAAELNSYPGPRHVLDAIAAGKLPASREQLERIHQVFNTMNSGAVNIGAKTWPKSRL